eukprot:comp21470_c0_seq1/m.29720 comp21470_c0_seq1/g.29720  ORF comp21470_c0_seq1/g.29720 comp21470_c0_seq1/m.29720 type:complete len:242 (+) comp21470_c0_seq1:909-1634(+)
MITPASIKMIKNSTATAIFSIFKVTSAFGVVVVGACSMTASGMAAWLTESSLMDLVSSVGEDVMLTSSLSSVTTMLLDLTVASDPAVCAFISMLLFFFALVEGLGVGHDNFFRESLHNFSLHGKEVVHCVVLIHPPHPQGMSAPHCVLWGVGHWLKCMNKGPFLRNLIHTEIGGENLEIREIVDGKFAIYGQWHLQITLIRHHGLVCDLFYLSVLHFNLDAHVVYCLTVNIYGDPFSLDRL